MTVLNGTLSYPPLLFVKPSINMYISPPCHPQGFVAAISPFNFTAIGGNLAGTPAIVGNVVLWKPALTTMLASYLVYKIFQEAGVPDGNESFFLLFIHKWLKAMLV